MNVDPELDELERNLDAAFASARPRPAFRDELEARLQRRGRRPWWQLPLMGPARWPVLGSAVALLMMATVVTLLAGPLHPGGRGGAGNPTLTHAPVAGVTPTPGAGLAPQIKSPCESPSPTPTASPARPTKPSVPASCHY